MNPARRLAEIVSALEQVGLTVLVMGGHAVRYYGIDRNTIDYDLPLSPPELVLVNRLRTVAPASALHLALIEVVRRQYKLSMQNADAADKQAVGAAQANPPPKIP